MKSIFKMPGGDVRWGWKAAILIVGTLLFGIVLNGVLTIVLVAVYSSQGLAPDLAMEQASNASTGFMAQVVLSLLQLGFMVWLVWRLVEKVEKQKFEWSGLGLINRTRSKHISLGIAVAVALSLLTIALGFLAGTLKYIGNGFELFTFPQVVITLFLATLISFASGFGEEVAFRGYLQSRLAQRYNPTTAIVIVAVLFALLHPFGNAIHPLLYLATAVLVGILFGTIFARTGLLWMGIALHVVWNYLQMAIIAIRNSADERFFGAPLFVFEITSSTIQMFIEFVVIFIGVLFILLALKPAEQNMMEKKQSELHQGEFKARRFP
jgi:membrane protease YdiL (CAAX protease family)